MFPSVKLAPSQYIPFTLEMPAQILDLLAKFLLAFLQAPCPIDCLNSLNKVTFVWHPYFPPPYLVVLNHRQPLQVILRL